MAFTNEVSVGVGWGQRIRRVPPRCICVGWAWVGQRTAAEKRGSRGREGLQNQEENDESRESSPLPRKAARGESCPLRIRLTQAFPPVFVASFQAVPLLAVSLEGLRELKTILNK